MNQMTFRVCFFAAVACALFIGCSGPTTCEVSGAVSVDGQPAKSGAMSFIPVDGKGTTGGAVIKDGKYTATIKLPLVDEKPVPQSYRVEIRVPKVVGQQKLYAEDPNSPVQQVMDESLPPKFNSRSELTFDAQPGEAAQDFAVSTKE